MTPRTTQAAGPMTGQVLRPNRVKSVSTGQPVTEQYNTTGRPVMCTPVDRTGRPKQSEEIARASGEQVEAGGSLASKTVSGSKSSTLAHPLSSASSANIMYMDEFDTCVATVNIAVIWFHLHEYVKALSVLEPLYQNIGPIDETTALHICLLLLDAGLACHDAPKSADVLIYLEKAFGVSCTSQSDNGSSVAQQPANLVGKSSSLPSSSLATDASNTELVSNNASEKGLSRTLSEETLDYDPVLFDIDVTRPTGLSLSNDILRNSVDRSISSVDLKLKLHLYRVRFLLLTRNLKQAKREVKHAMNIARGRDSPMALLLKSQLEYARGNHRKAIKLLMASSNRTDTGILSMFHNNLGCIYYQLGKYHTSSVFFSKALNNCSSLRKDKPLKLSTFSQDNSLLIVYNCGMQYLACGKPFLAARCFQKAGLIFYNRPLLWLRLAECCLMALETGILKSNLAQDRSEIRISVIGKGKWRQLVFEDGILRNGNVDLERGDLVLGSDGEPKLSLPLARQCLHNALFLLNGSELSYLKSIFPSNSSVDENDTTDIASSKNLNHKNLQNIDLKASTVAVSLGQINANGDAKEQKGGTTQELVQNSLTSYEDTCKRENMLIKQALLANLAYIELELGNPIKAHLNARALCELPECSRVYLFLGHIFAAEALCLLNREKEAIEHLSIYLSEGNVELPFSQEDCERGQVDRTGDCEELNGGQASAKNSYSQDVEGIVFLKPEEAHAALYVNFASLYAMQGEFELAHQFVSQALSLTPNSPEANLTAVYINLMHGKPQEALAKLKQCSRIRFLSSGLTSNISS
ncbi:CCR4-NOT transcription complex subunit 10 [Morus notabilis]|uniref:CCR4-NOT transcription complex subunit 10 n=1 Tax=Morus notabilis TaxID=981085 RepID=W9QK37_9ROSA|nr:CCR4-NOT transcription complex subunit 10 [Morus notabilis]